MTCNTKLPVFKCVTLSNQCVYHHGIYELNIFWIYSYIIFYQCDDLQYKSFNFNGIIYWLYFKYCGLTGPWNQLLKNFDLVLGSVKIGIDRFHRRHILHNIVKIVQELRSVYRVEVNQASVSIFFPLRFEDTVVICS